jgi:hypothetical protein
VRRARSLSGERSDQTHDTTTGFASGLTGEAANGLPVAIFKRLPGTGDEAAPPVSACGPASSEPLGVHSDPQASPQVGLVVGLWWACR